MRLGKNQDHAGKDMACLSEFDLLNDASAVFFIIVQTQAVPGMNEQYFRSIICGCFNGIYAAFCFEIDICFRTDHGALYFINDQRSM